MANVDDLMKLNREQLNEFAKNNGVENPEGFENKRTLAEEVSPNVTDDQLQSYVGEQKAASSEDEGEDSGEGEGAEGSDSGENTDGADSTDEVGAGEDPTSVAAGGVPQTEEDQAATPDEDTKTPEAPYDESDKEHNTENGRVDTTASGTPGAPQNDNQDHMDGIAHPR